ncbi:fatty-acyl-CoA synthase [Nocardioides daedukensis]|uniref:Fatty-acyl-CoA synthase n=1 Tax=Nocardioides daedukensis TaxID=634462 RepID=A0A7Y9USA6_9ACTN|nr:AMP-binding protein [Nocardioides daedukensis]NYG60731.1 fatty-acyl-CoA synthase [Nocardioides daedukensis]
MGKTRERLASGATSAKVLLGAGIVEPFGPRKLVGLAGTVLKWGTGPAGGFTTLAVRYPDRPGLIDELGTLTFGELEQRSNALADSLRRQGIREGDSVAVMARNHRGFVDATLAIAKLGADILYLNTAFAGPQLVDVLAREKPKAVIHDEEFTDLLAGAAVENRILAWVDSSDPAVASLESLIASGSPAALTPPKRHAKVVILTSGTTGTPKGAPRKEAGIPAAVSLLSRMPLKARWRTHIAAPLFHTWGFAHLMLGMLLGSTAVLTRRFEPETALATATSTGCKAIVVIPVMLQRILQLPQDTIEKYDLSAVEVVAASGSALPGDLALKWMDTFGDNLYNIYGSTEVAYASIATPEDLRAAPDSAGKPPHATVVRIFDESGNEVPQGTSGRIFVGNGLLFEGYTGGGNKELIDGLMSSGDVGRFDEFGRLYVEGRDDEMIVSGGENVFPKEVEDCLARHDGVVEVAAIGIDDDDFGTRLRAFVVTSRDVDEEELKAWVRKNLARFKVPKEFVFLDELPRNATGKVLKRELTEWQRD